MTDQPKDILEVIDELKNLKCPQCEGRGYTDIWPPYGGVDKERCYCESHKQRRFEDVLVENYDQIAAELRAARAVCEEAEKEFEDLCDVKDCAFCRIFRLTKAWRKVRSEGK